MCIISSTSSLILCNAGLATIPYTGRKFLPRRGSKQLRIAHYALNHVITGSGVTFVVPKIERKMNITREHKSIRVTFNELFLLLA